MIALMRSSLDAGLRDVNARCGVFIPVTGCRGGAPVVSPERWPHKECLDWRSFWSAPVFSGAFGFGHTQRVIYFYLSCVSPLKLKKAAEGSRTLHDADARSTYRSILAKLLVPLSFSDAFRPTIRGQT